MQMSPKFQQKAIFYLICHPSIFTIVATIATSTFMPFGRTCLGLLIMIIKFFFSTKKKILENIMIFLPNVSFNSPFVPPTIQHVGLEKMSKNKIK